LTRDTHRKRNRILINKIRYENAEQRIFAGALDNCLLKYPGLKSVAGNSPDIRDAGSTMIDLYQGRKRLSKRFVMEHCLETAEIVSQYTVHSIYLKTAMFHDLREDLHLSFEEIKDISGQNGAQIAAFVTTLSKDVRIKNRKERNTEYFNRLYRAISGGNRGVGLVKIADRCSNLRDLAYHTPEKRIEISRQTLVFYLPIALRLRLISLAIKLMVLSVPHIGSELKKEGIAGEP
jgi:(p)ppGpp synthase/HD superfamily hydrolase